MVLIALRISTPSLFVLKAPQKSPILDCGMVFFVVFDPGDPDVFDPEEGTGKILVAKGFQQVWQDCGKEAGLKREGETEQLRKDQEPQEMLEGSWPPDKDN